MWGRLGYPRRAARLHASAIVIGERFDGQVPQSDEDLRSLPGVGEYTSAAVRAFAFGQRSVVMDTNVRRVLARTLDGVPSPPAHIVSAERTRADDLWPHAPGRSARWSAAVMEFGALVCTARRPDCASCLLRSECRWTLLDQPAVEAPRSLRDAAGPMARAELESAWPDAQQARRALDGLMADGLVAPSGPGAVALPGDRGQATGST